MSPSGSSEPEDRTAKKHRFSTVDVCRKLLDLIAVLERHRAIRFAKQERPPRREAPPSKELRALCSDAISVDEYLLLKLDKALEPLRPLLPPEHLTVVQTAMRERLRSEPAWVRVAVELRERLQREPGAARTDEPGNDRQ